MQNTQSTPAENAPSPSKGGYVMKGLGLAILTWIIVFFAGSVLLNSIEKPAEQRFASDFRNNKEAMRQVTLCHTFYSIKALHPLPCDDTKILSDIATDYNERIASDKRGRNQDNAMLAANFAFIFVWPIPGIYLSRRAKRRSLVSAAKPSTDQL